MRKLLLILALIFVCFAVAERTERRVPEPIATTQVEIDRAQTNEWLCEERCNSDLNLPQAVEVPPTTLTRSVSGRLLHPTLPDLSASHCLAQGEHYFSQITQPNIAHAATRSADFYVIRLRRLII